ncbi:MAG: hypothetical protein JW747_01350 [Candidatus Aminicenantes bacterium]|nr:hypothetical protein [Candidatus Aminicenantes bacterium]
MTQVNILIKPLQSGEVKTAGKILFLLGVGFLFFSGTLLVGFKDFSAQHASIILIVFLSSLALLLAGESLIAVAGHLDSGAGRKKVFFHWMAEPLSRPKPIQGRQCSFCGMNFILPPVSESENESRERDFDRPIFGVCLGCGKTVCPRCAYMKGQELKIKSLHCPGCGSLVL